MTTQSRKDRSANLRPRTEPMTPEQRQRAAALPRLGVPAQPAGAALEAQRAAKDAAYEAWKNGELLQPSMQELMWMCSETQTEWRGEGNGT